jgi:ERCC4-type nuclease
MTLLIDRRVGSKELVTYLPEGSYTLTDLEAGDVAFLGYGPDGPLTYPIGIERKTYYDLLECFKDTRLNQQIQRMSNYYKKVYLVIEGRPRVNHVGQILVPRKVNGKTDWVESRITYSQIDNYLNTITDEAHIQHKRSFNLEESCWQILDIYNHCSTDKHGSHLRIDSRWEINPYMPPSFKYRVAYQLDGIGDKKAELAAASFKSVYDMAVAEEDQWKMIPGVGKTLAKRIVAQFRGQ